MDATIEAEISARLAATMKVEFTATVDAWLAQHPDAGCVLVAPLILRNAPHPTARITFDSAPLGAAVTFRATIGDGVWLFIVVNDAVEGWALLPDDALESELYAGPECPQP
jgi:hypothetical protein